MPFLALVYLKRDEISYPNVHLHILLCRSYIWMTVFVLMLLVEVPYYDISVAFIFGALHVEALELSSLGV